VLPRSQSVEIVHRTPDVPVTVLVDGHRFAELGTGEGIAVRLGDDPARLGMLPEATFFRRYRETFAS
jgi:NAD kinase